jgi:hypothetical protein
MPILPCVSHDYGLILVRDIKVVWNITASNYQNLGNGRFIYYHPNVILYASYNRLTEADG